MASYWKSPYKESTLANNGIDIYRQEPVPILVPPTRPPSAKKLEAVQPVSPQDWFDSALTVSNSKPMSPTPRKKHSADRIKGILKIQDDSDMSDAGRASQTSESHFSATSDITASKKEKKKVKFVVSDAITKDDHVALGPRFQSDRSTSAYRHRMKQTQFLDEFSRNNLKKLLNRTTAFSALPSVNGKCIISRKSGTRPISYSEKCKHSPDLRCANCFQDNAKKVRSVHKYSENDSFTYNDNGDRESDHSSTTEHNEKEETELKTDPRKRYQRYWSQSGGKLQLKKKWVPHRGGTGPVSFSAGTLRKRLSRNERPIMQAKPNLVFEEFEKLHINGDRKKIETKLNTVGVPGNSNVNGEIESPRISKNTGGHLGMLEALLQPGERNLARRDENNNTNSAPSRLKSQRIHNLYGVTVHGKDEEAEKCLDKTSQILTWLKDVREKENYQPRNARLYALEPQQYH